MSNFDEYAFRSIRHASKNGLDDYSSTEVRGIKISDQCVCDETRHLTDAMTLGNFHPSQKTSQF